jgi:hypothetical protein
MPIDNLGANLISKKQTASISTNNSQLRLDFNLTGEKLVSDYLEFLVSLQLRKQHKTTTYISLKYC